MRHRLLLLIPLLGLCCLGMGKKELPLSIRFYTQTTQGDSASFSAPVKMLNGRDTYVDQVASISERDIAAVQPSVAADGSGACLLQLDDHGTVALDSLSVEKRGSILIAFINAHQILDILIDQRVSDGRLWISSGITTDEMKLILKKYPIIGGKKAVKKKKKDIYSVGF
jgi:hypothetical protein